MRIKIINVDIESVQGRTTYEKAEVLYEAFGKKDTKNIVSFSNPEVFKTIKDSKKGDEFEVTVTKDKNGYNQWSSIGPVGSSQPASAASNGADNKPKSAGSLGGRDYESKEERDRRQVLIVRQSSLTNAIAVLTTGSKTPPDPEAVKKLAQEFVDFVFQADTSFSNVDLFTQDNDLDKDIPY
ncbi:MAG TPA: hypothetical protein VFM18_23390 [Methanosarcina sp.]|nr:hypothetical protein [Methanosarcina sp.]